MIYIYVYIRFDSSIRSILACVYYVHLQQRFLVGSRSSNPVISSASSKSTEPPSASPLKSLALGPETRPTDGYGYRRSSTIYIYIFI